MTARGALALSRREHKYLVPESLLPALRRAVAGFLGPDRHATPRDGGAWLGYTVRSIYFDTSRLAYYFQTADGVAQRAKLRIRAYDAYLPNGDVILEVKRRDGMVTAKLRSAVPCAHLESLLAGGDVARFAHPTPELPDSVANARQFLFRVRRDALHPTLLVVYDREPYVGLREPTLRVTFDRAIRSMPFPSLRALYAERAARAAFPGHVVLEVKYDPPNAFPDWLRPFIATHGLTRGGLSKYRTGVEGHGLTRPPLRARVLGLAASMAPRA